MFLGMDLQLPPRRTFHNSEETPSDSPEFLLQKHVLLVMNFDNL